MFRKIVTKILIAVLNSEWLNEEAPHIPKLEMKRGFFARRDLARRVSQIPGITVAEVLDQPTLTWQDLSDIVSNLPVRG